MSIFSESIDEVFDKFQESMNEEHEVREKIRLVVRDLEIHQKMAATQLQVIHSDLDKIDSACIEVKKIFEKLIIIYSELAKLVPTGQYYRFNEHFSGTTQRIVFLITLTHFLETGVLLSRDDCAKSLGLKTKLNEGFALELDDYLIGVLQLASELSRFATNSVTLDDFVRPMQISKFLGELNSGFRLLNLKNDALRRRFDVLKYDVKKVEEIVYDLRIRGLIKNVEEIKEKSSEETAGTKV